MDPIEQRLHQLRQLGEQYARAKAATVKIEEGKKSTLAVLMKKYEAKGITTAVAQEREARADPEYMKMLESLETAVYESESARWQLEVAKLGVEVWRTKQANDRVERKGYGA